nr:hypothetical protein CFP56_73558 [Quercus suber]
MMNFVKRRLHATAEGRNDDGWADKARAPERERRVRRREEAVLEPFKAQINPRKEDHDASPTAQESSVDIERDRDPRVFDTRYWLKKKKGRRKLHIYSLELSLSTLQDIKREARVGTGQGEMTEQSSEIAKGCRRFSRITLQDDRRPDHVR